MPPAAGASSPGVDTGEQQRDVPRMFTKCGEGDQGYTLFYFILPRKAGGHIGTGASGSRSPPDRWSPIFGRRR
jgi:hypothetical protein